MARNLSRRDFLKIGGLAAGSLAFNPFQPEREEQPRSRVVRVTIRAISIYQQPSFESRIVGQRFRDELLPIYYPVQADDGPLHNRRWYRVWGGYAHSAHLQRVEVRYNFPLREIPETGQLCEVTVPFSQSFRYTNTYGWQPAYRLYFSSTHWATSIDEGPDGDIWYQITDELWPIDYHVPASHLRAIPDDELTPLSPEVPDSEKRIEVDLARQLVTAFEGDQAVRQAIVSTGLRSTGRSTNGIPTDTPLGRFNLQVKLPSKHMGQGRLTDDLEDYVLPGVPWTSFFHPTGVAFHGTYWHDNFGTRMSHGCVNMRNEDAKWLFRWSSPVNEPHSWERRGFGTSVLVF